MSKEQIALIKSLIKFQSMVDPILKDSDNPFFKSKYADLGSIWKSIKPALTECGLCISQLLDTVSTEHTYYDVINTFLFHVEGGELKSTVKIKVKKGKEDDSQAFGSAITYARRYALSAILGVVTDDDDDGNAASNNVNGGGSKFKPPAPSIKISVDQEAHINDLMAEVGSDKDALLSYFKIEKVSDLMVAQYNKAVSILNKKRASHD